MKYHGTQIKFNVLDLANYHILALLERSKAFHFSISVLHVYINILFRQCNLQNKTSVEYYILKQITDKTKLQ